MVAYRCRYEPYNQAMIKMARDKEFGTLKVILADHGFNIGDPTQWRLNKKLAGRRLADGHRHLRLQAARYMTGEEPVEVNAHDLHHAGRSALQGSRGDDQLPAALPERRARQLHLELRLHQPESLSRGLLRRLVRAGARHQLYRPADADPSRKHA